MTPEKAVLISSKSVEICKSLGLTGRVFANRKKALAMAEGPTEIVQHYFKAVSSDPLVESILLQTDRKIERREFEDYSVWLNLNVPFAPVPGVSVMTLDAISQTFPAKPSVKLRIMAEAYLTDDMIAA